MACLYGSAVSIGFLIGICVFYFMNYFLSMIEANRFKRYLSERTDEERMTIKKEIDEILSIHKRIAYNTNTMFFKRKTNSLITFIKYLEQYRLN